MKKILFLSPYPQDVAPSQRLKYEQYYDSLEKEGYEISIHPFISDDFWKIIYQKGYILQKVFYTFLGYLKRTIVLFSIRKYDVVYVHLWITPLGIPFFEFITCILAKKVVYDIDDMVFLGHSSSANRFFQVLKGKYKMIFLMKKAYHVITCTPTLDEYVRKYNQKTTDISSTINTELYKPKENFTLPETITLGWSGSHSTSKYLMLLEPVFEILLKEKINFNVLVIGDKDFKFKNENIPLNAIPWQLETEVEDLKKIDIGLYPLPNEKWVLGKSGLKALQYMSLGIPTVAQAIGANFRIIKNNENGFLVNEILEWVEVIKLLIHNSNLREKISKNSIKTVEEHYSIKANLYNYLNALK